MHLYTQNSTCSLLQLNFAKPKLNESYQERITDLSIIDSTVETPHYLTVLHQYYLTVGTIFSTHAHKRAFIAYRYSTYAYLLY